MYSKDVAMDGSEAIEVNRETLKRIAATLLALAMLAERASGMSRPVRCLVLWILRTAEAIAREFVTEVTQSPQHSSVEFALAFMRSGDSSADAVCLALRFRAMARALDDLSPKTLPVWCVLNNRLDTYNRRLALHRDKAQCRPCFSRKSWNPVRRTRCAHADPLRL